MTERDEIGHEGPDDPSWPRCGVEGCTEAARWQSRERGTPRRCKRHEPRQWWPADGGGWTELGPPCEDGCGQRAVARFGEWREDFRPGPALCDTCADARRRQSAVSECRRVRRDDEDEQGRASHASPCSASVGCIADPRGATHDQVTRVLAQHRAEDDERRIVARYESRHRTRIELHAEHLNPDHAAEHAAWLMAQVGAMLAERAKAGDIAPELGVVATVAAFAGEDIARALYHAEHRGPAELRRTAERLGGEYGRALDAIRYVTAGHGGAPHDSEMAALYAGRLETAGGGLLRKFNEMTGMRGDEALRRERAREALERARSDGWFSRCSDFRVLRAMFTLKRDRQAPYGARLTAQRQAGKRTLSAEHEARLLRPLLESDGIRFQSLDALKKALDRGRKVRRDHYIGPTPSQSQRETRKPKSERVTRHDTAPRRPPVAQGRSGQPKKAAR